jgi:hypothetical protein
MVMKQARPRLKALAALAPQLNEATDRYVAEIKAIEAELQQLNLGVEVELNRPFLETPLQEEQDYNSEVSQSFYLAQRLGWGRHRDTWGFVVYDYRVDCEGSGSNLEETWKRQDETPLLQTSRQIRIAAAKHVLQLLDEIEAVGKKYMESLDEVRDR